MSHAEIWDDSALVESWNEALEEYKHYHSIHARGENVEETLQASRKPSDPLEAPAQAALPEKENSMKADDSPIDGAGELGGSFEEAESQNKLSSADQTAKLKREGPLHAGPEIPRHLIGSIHDEGLKSLLMSWYYAGYYTGLYEGQHRAT